MLCLLKTENEWDTILEAVAYVHIYSLFQYQICDVSENDS